MIRKAGELLSLICLFGSKDEIIGLLFLVALLVLVFCDFAVWYETERAKKDGYYEGEY